MLHRPPFLPHRATTTSRGRALALAVIVSVSAAACDASGSDDASAGCADIVRDASLAVEVEEQIRLLDRALLVCRSVDSLTNELERYPGIVGYETATYVSLRCAKVDDEAIREAPTCSAVITPATTVPPTTLPEIVFVGDTLDGRQVEIRPSATTRFEGDVPAVVQQTVDIAIESGCEGVIEQRDLWASRVDDTELGDEASVYAQHAQNVANYIKCDAAPLTS